VLRHLDLALFALALALAPTFARAGCSRELAASFISVERLVDSLRPEKAGVARVFAYDGSEYTGGEALWMKGKLRAILAECNRNDEAHALPDLEEVLSLVRAHHRPSAAASTPPQGH
jgi:hypothetical protein